MARGKTNFTLEVEKDWCNRIKILKSGKQPVSIQQRNYWYELRTLTYQKHKEIACGYAYFKYTIIYDLEEKYGHTREELGITAKPDGVLYTRKYGTELIQYKHELYPLICVIVTEKSGIAEVLSEYLLRYGIFIVDTTGIRGRYSNQYVKNIKAPKFCIEDFDITGCFMAKKFEEEAEAQRISLLKIMKELKIKREDVVEEDKGGSKNNHWKKIRKEDQEKLYQDGKYWRIEIDSVMKFIKPEKFAEIIIYLLDKEIPIKDMNRVMELGEWIYLPLIPNEDEDKIRKNIEKLENKYQKERQKILAKYEGMKKSFVNLDLDVLEQNAKEEFEKLIKNVQN